MKVSGVYKISFSSGNFYIGSSVDVGRRIACHKRELCRGSHINTALQNAFNKYGIQGFSYEVIKQCDPKEVRHWEQIYIQNLSPEYNISKQADCALFDRFVINKRIQAVSKPVKCLNTGQIYPSAYEAVRSIGLEKQKNQIFTAIKNKYLFGGMFWSYVEDSITFEQIKNDHDRKEELRKSKAAKSVSNKRSRSVIRLSDNKIFKSARQAELLLGLRRAAVFEACKLNQFTGGSYWCYADTPITKEEAQERHKKRLDAQKTNQKKSVIERQSIKVKNLSTGTVYLSIKDAAKSLGIRGDRLSYLIKSNKKIKDDSWGFVK